LKVHLSKLQLVIGYIISTYQIIMPVLTIR
jgi:hypothetical protein